MPLPGGMMTYGIPTYRLPREALFFEIEHILRVGMSSAQHGLGCRLHDQEPAGRTVTAAVVLTLGAHRSRALGIKGEDEGHYHAVQMLRDIAWQRPPDLKGKRVVVIGGGDTAIDAARSAWRLGASRGPRRSSAASATTCRPPEEIEGAEEDGVQFHFLVSRVEVLRRAPVTG
jgi:heterodisulfide reductase subunit A2